MSCSPRRSMVLQGVFHIHPKPLFGVQGQDGLGLPVVMLRFPLKHHPMSVPYTWDLLTDSTSTVPAESRISLLIGVPGVPTRNRICRLCLELSRAGARRRAQANTAPFTGRCELVPIEPVHTYRCDCTLICMYACR